MKGLLSLHDVSPYIYTGMTTDKYADFNIQGFPMGGIKYFLNAFGATSLRGGGDFAFFFDSSTDRKSLLPSYKSGRNSNPAVYAQLDFLYDYLMSIGIPCYKVDGFEADDLIFSAVEYNRDKYSAMKVFSADKDLMHNVDRAVRFEAVNSNVNSVTAMNFSEAVIRGKSILLNTLSAHKVFCGDTSDKVPALPERGEQLYNRFCTFLTENSPNGYVDPALARHVQALQIFLNAIDSELTAKEKEHLSVNIQVVYPRKAEGIDFYGLSAVDSDRDGIAKLMSICYEFAPLKILGKPQFTLTPEDIEMFKDKARTLRTGEYAADRSISFESDFVAYESFSMRSFD
jgi:hypothetical protein